MATSTSLIISTSLMALVSNTFAETYTCDNENTCEGEEISCSSPHWCLIICKDDACNSMTVNMNSIDSFTFNSSNASSVTINANNALQTNIHCIGANACKDFTVYAASDVVNIEAIEAFAISDGEWHLEDASAISLTCASDSDEDGACLATWNVPSAYDDGAVFNLYCYGFGCKWIRAQTTSSLISSWNVHMNGCTQCESADDCVAGFNWKCLWSTSYNTKTGTSSSGFVQKDSWTGAVCTCGPFDCGCCEKLILRNWTNTFVDDKCVGSKPVSKQTGFSTSAIYIALIAGAICICAVVLIMCRKRKKEFKQVEVSSPVSFAPPITSSCNVANHVLNQQAVVMVPSAAAPPPSYKESSSEYNLIREVLKESGVANWEKILQRCVDNDMTDDVLKTIPKDDGNWDKLIPSIGAKVKFQNAWFRKLDALPSYNEEGCKLNAVPSYNNEGGAVTYQ